MLIRSDTPPRRALANALYSAASRIGALSVHPVFLPSFVDTARSSEVRQTAENEVAERLEACAAEAAELARAVRRLANGRDPFHSLRAVTLDGQTFLLDIHGAELLGIYLPDSAQSLLDFFKPAEREHLVSLLQGEAS